MLYCPFGRDALLQFMPKGGEIAEIGVAKGEFSRLIFDAVQPRRLHLIDPWSFQDRTDYLKDINNVADGENEARYQSVIAAFATEIAEGRVVVHRAFSPKASELFTDGQLDWVYIDGMHTYQAVKADLHAWARKIRPDGLILGDDYAVHEVARNAGFGVAEAVNEFVLAHNWAFLVLTADCYPTFVLAPRVDTEMARYIIGNIIHRVTGIIEIAEFPRLRRLQQSVITMGDNHKVLSTIV